MCLLTFYPPGAQPDTSKLQCGATLNEDGHGFAIVVGDRLVIQRSMDSEKLIDRFQEVRKAHPDGPAMFHSRMATAGLIDKSNCHPFYVGGNRGNGRTVVAHNGIMPQEVQPRKGDLRSDTRIFAEDHLPQRAWYKAKGRQKLGRWLGGDKIVILTVDPGFDDRAYLINGQHGEWVDGVWYSNDGYKWNGARWSSVYYYTYSSGHFEYSWGTVYSKYLSTEQGWHWHMGGTTTVTCDSSDCHSVKWERTKEQDVPPWIEAYWAGDDDDWPTTIGTRQISPIAVGGTGWADHRKALATRTNEVCNQCHAKGTVSSVVGYCTVCFACQECGDAMDECLCYVPAQLDRVHEGGTPAVLEGMAQYGH